MKKFTINCDFGGQIAPFTIYLGQPEPGHHPLHFQGEWLSKERGGTIPAQVMDAIAKLKDLSEKNQVSFEELCVYALGAAQQNSTGPEGEEAVDEESDSDTLEAIEAPAEEIAKDAGVEAVVEEVTEEVVKEKKPRKKKKSE